jgi:flagellar motor switch protein FliN/FliY
MDLTPMQPTAGAAVDLAALDRVTEVVVEVAIEVGRTKMTLGEAMALGPGSVITVERFADQPVDLLVNGKPIARGEVVVIDEQFGLRITDIAQGPVGAPVARIDEPAA